MDSIYLILIGAVALGFAEAINGHLLKKFKEVSSVGLILVGSFVTFVLSGIWLLVFRPPMIELNYTFIILIIAVGLLSYFGNKYFYNSFKYQEASTSSIIVMSTIVVTSVFGFIVFNERLNIIQWIGIALVLTSVVLINMGEVSFKKLKEILKPTSATKYVLFAALLYGFANSLSKLIVLDINPHYYQFLDIVIVTPLFLLIDRREVTSQIKVVFKLNVFKNFAPVILLYFTFNILRYTALSRGIELPIADAIDNSVIFIIIALEILVFKVKTVGLLQKVGIGLLAIIGVTLVRVFS